ncbi:MAG: PKD domain-containing protein [Crocinitomicaceae bacterium]
MKRLFSLALGILFGGVTLAQSTDVVMNAGNNGTTFITCLGGLYDSGGTGANAPYSNNENYVVTICPDNPTDFITLQWTVFNLDCTDNLPGPPTDADHITIYDGDNTGAPTLGTYYCGQLTPGDLFGASPFNTTGCLTIEFVSNSTGTGDFNAQISCDTPCDPGFAAGAIVGGPTPDSIAVCVGDVVTFQDAGSTAGTSGLFTLTKWVWQWMDGTPNDTLYTPGQVTHSWASPGQYVVQLQVIDDNDCANTNATDIQVFVTTFPTFDPFPADTTICVGETLDLQAFPDQYETTWSGFPLNTWIDDNCMEDLTGIVQPTPMAITGYDSNISLNSANPDIFSICVDIEHSFIGDFVLQVQCPTGQVMTLHQQGGGGANLGAPDQGTIDCADPNTFGVPWHYCFTPSATQTWVQAIGAGQTMPNGTGGNSVIPGDYAPIDPWSNLDGCPINGTWQLLFTDLWGADDGSLPGWEINFDPNLNPPVTVFTPQIGLGNDSSYWDSADPWITNTSADGNTITIAPGAGGTFTYDFTVVNNFGCSFDSTVTVTVDTVPPVDAGLDTALCDALVGVGVGPNGFSASCDYTLDLVDTYGDGWNGNTITVWINGVPTNYTATGTGSTFTISVSHGDQIDLQWNATGSWQSECEIYFYDANGVLIHSDGTNWSVPSTALYTFTADCLGGMVFSWTPNNGTISDPSIPNPTVTPTATTMYYLSAYPAGHPACAVVDSVQVLIGGGLDAGLDSTAMLCFEGPAVTLFDWLGGTPQGLGQWYNPAGQAISMPVSPDTLIDGGLYEYRKDSAGCTLSAYITVEIYQTTATATVTPSDCQAFNGEVNITVTSGISPVQFSNDGGTTFQASGLFGPPGAAMGSGNAYSFLIQDSLGCVFTIDTIVPDTNVPTLDNIVVADAGCFGVCDGLVSLSGTNLVNYSIDGGATFQASNNFNGLCGTEAGTVYNVVVDNGFGCTVDSTFTVYQPPVLDLTQWPSNINLCPGEELTVAADGVNGIGNIQYSWASSGTALGTTTGPNDSLGIITTGNMMICVTMSDDCPSTDMECFSVSEPPPIVFNMSSTDPAGCAKHSVTFYNNSTGSPIAQTVWTFSDGSTVISQGADSVTHIFQTAGIYSVGWEITTTAGCVYTTSYNDYVTVYANPDANFNWSPIPATIYDTEVNFIDFSSSDVVQWYWELAGGVPVSSSVPNPTVVYPEGVPGDYPVMLTVTNDNGCIDSMEVLVQVINDVILYAPNVFTPTNDEYNETWRLYITGIDIYDFHLTMFNRWGEIVWESYNTEGAWNGHYGSGGLVPDGTYVWVIEAKDVYNDRKYEFRGHVTVLK